MQMNKMSHVPSCVQFCWDHICTTDAGTTLTSFFLSLRTVLAKSATWLNLPAFQNCAPFYCIKCHPGSPLVLVATLTLSGKQSCNWPTVIGLQRLGAKKGLGNQKWAWFCPKVPGLGEKQKASLNTNPGEPCKLRNSPFMNAKGRKGKVAWLVLPLCLLSVPFLHQCSGTVGWGSHRERQGLQGERRKGLFKSA